MPLKPCLHRYADGRGCSAYARDGASRCELHDRERMRNRTRTPSSQISQTNRWKKLRESVVRDRQRPDGSWWCELGKHVILDKLQIDVDHRVSVADRPDLAYSRDNLRLSCRHHNRSAGGKLVQARKREGTAEARARRRAR